MDAVGQFLKSPDWQGQVSSFMDMHSSAFCEGEHTHGAYEIYEEFRAMVDEILEKFLLELGGNPESFIKACDEYLSQNDRGPREAAAKEMMRQLFTFDDFKEFSRVMVEHSAALDAGRTPDPSTAFIPPLNIDSSVSEQKVAQDTSGANGSDNVWYDENGYAYNAEGYVYDNAGLAYNVDGYMYDVDGNAVKPVDRLPGGGGGAAEDEELKQQLWASEWELQLQLANRYLEGELSGRLQEGEEGLLPWARAVVEMCTLLTVNNGAVSGEMQRLSARLPPGCVLLSQLACSCTSAN